MLKKIIRRILLPNKYSSDAYVNYLIKKGIKIGEGTKIWSPNQTFIDETRPYLISIGKYCKITRGVTILSHDYSRSVLRRVYGENIGEAKETKIGDNVFLGNNCIILMGSDIGNNCIIGAGAVVSNSFPDNVVIGGNPARIICSLDEHYQKRKKASVWEAKHYAAIIFERTGRIPTIEEMGNAFAWLYLPRTKESISKYLKFFLLSGDVKDEIINGFMNSIPVYNSFDDFIVDCNLPLK